LHNSAQSKAIEPTNLSTITLWINFCEDILKEAKGLGGNERNARKKCGLKIAHLWANALVNKVLNDDIVVMWTG